MLCKFKYKGAAVMRKHFILSKRTAISKHNVTKSFGVDNTVIIPMAVLDEVAEISQKFFDERGKIARELLEYLWSLDRKALFGDGVCQDNGSILKVTVNYRDESLPDQIKDTKLSSVEERILKTCLGVKKEIPSNQKVVLISKNPLLRMKAELIGIESETFRDELLLEVHEQYTGRIEIDVTEESLKEFSKEGEILVSSLNSDEHFYQNMFVTMRSGQASQLGRVQGDKIVKLVHDRVFPYGIIPKNAGQKMLIESLMMDYNIAPLVIIKGPAGTAKTLISLAVGLQLSLELKQFPNGILISRSPTETGEKIGFLPGDEQQKIDPFMRGIMDNLKVLMSDRQYSSTKAKSYQGKGNWQDEKPSKEDGSWFFENGYIKAEAVGFIRGRSICDSYIIIDEAQNLSPTEIKTIITRAAIGTKLVIIGDPEQIDRPGLNERNNGLSYASERMRGNEACWQVTMKDEESVRSQLARIASILL